MSLLFTVLAYLMGIYAVTVNGNICSPSPMYPYGRDRGDATIEEGDDGFVQIDFGGYNVSFYGSRFSFCWLNINGLVSFRESVMISVPPTFATSVSIIAPLWSDVCLDESGNGTIFYRLVDVAKESDVVDLVKTDSAAAGYPLEPDFILMATWYKVKTYHTPNDAINTFQAVLASDGNMSVTIFNYDEINWVKHVKYAAVRFDKGNRATKVDFPFSMAAEVKNVVDYSNVGLPGKIVTRVDGEIQLPELTKYRCASCVVERDSGNLITFDGFQELNVHEPNQKYLLSKSYQVDSDGNGDKCNYMLKITTDANGGIAWVSFTVNSILKWNMAFERQKKDTVETRYRHVKKEIDNFPFNQIIQDNGEELYITIDRTDGGWIVRSQNCSYVLIYRPNAESEQLKFYLGEQYAGISYGMCQNNNNDPTDDKKKCSRPPEDVTTDDFAEVIGQSCSCSIDDKNCRKELRRL